MELEMIINLILLFILSQLLLGVYLWLKVRHLYKYPNLFGTPIIGNLYYFYKHLMIPNTDDYYQYFEKVRDKYGYDSFFTFSYGMTTLLISCPHLTKEICYNPHISDKPENYGYVNKIGKGILMYPPADNEWKTRRKEVTQAIKKNHIEGPFHEIFTKYAKKITEAIDEEQNPVDIYYHIAANIFNSTNETLFGMDDSTLADRTLIHQISLLSDWLAITMGNTVLGIIIYYISGPLSKILFSRTRKQKHEMAKTAIEKTKRIKENLQGQDQNVKMPLSVAIAMRNAHLNRPETEVEKELTELMLVAWHSTKITTSGVIAYLAIFPEIQEKVWEEQFQIFGNSERDPTVEDIQEMVYLERFLKESLRFISTKYVGKMATKDINVGETVIPAGTLLIFMMHQMRMDPRYWNDPQVFDPDRFLDEIHHVPTNSYLTFGLGVRSCPGMAYAFHQMKIIVSTIARKYKLSTDTKFEDLRYFTELLTRISNPPLIRFEKRKRGLKQM